jgi:hypothetical protein
MGIDIIDSFTEELINEAVKRGYSVTLEGDKVVINRSKNNSNESNHNVEYKSDNKDDYNSINNSHLSYDKTEHTFLSYGKIEHTFHDAGDGVLIARAKNRNDPLFHELVNESDGLHYFYEGRRYFWNKPPGQFCDD